MTIFDSLRRYLLPCFPTSTATTAAAATTKKRLSTSLRDDNHHQDRQHNQEESTTTTEETDSNDQVPPRPSKSMVTGTIYGHRRGHVCFCIQQDRLNCKPSLLFELSIPTYVLVKEMQCGILRIALKCDRPDMNSCPLHSIPIWTMYCNGRKVGFAKRKRVTDKDRLMLKTMQSISVGAGVIPAASEGEGEIIYMRASYERVVGNADSESFHLINPDNCPGQELSVFLLRSR
ncbi:PREDICTED: protein MIZU-KUSSEI 1 [Nelumbo nucifera]|uniref:Protein MIZU-KUSSEI 1 n=2 Tax=Nelumbo nucifera TaxID=4432 RepID=A0A1U7ZS81_NELNU|nr:PREDICTED: protein MIZU-KUSSEI 1 [Nelumbo nucifera]DAD26555.1 TPA_asm: hypothetical protein HUJ06_028023 [Nelumbo nucifera]